MISPYLYLCCLRVIYLPERVCRYTPGTTCIFNCGGFIPLPVSKF